MENIKVNNNKFIILKNKLKNMDAVEYILGLGLLASAIILILFLQTVTRYLFFTNSLLSYQNNLLGEYSDEVRNHNIENFYNISQNINKDKDVVSNLHIYQMSNNHNVERFPINNVPIALNILKRHKNKGINNNVYLVDLTYVSSDKNYSIQHQNVIMKAKDILYLENHYSNYLQEMYKSTHEQYIIDSKIKGELSQNVKNDISKDYQSLESNKNKG